MSNRDIIHQFLSRVVAWPKQGETAYVNIHFKKIPPPGTPPRNDDGTSWYGTPGTDIRTVTSIVTNLLNGATASRVRDIYFCTSLQKDAKEYTNKSGRPYKVASRHSRAAVAMKSIFLDLDLKNYGTPELLISAFGHFLTTIGMPYPTIVVYTGGGYHMYWCIEEALAPADWQPLADALAEATRQHGLVCDTQCTVDLARILRLPGTKNYKYDPLQDVKLMHMHTADYSVEELWEALEPFRGVRTHSIPAEGMELFPPKARITNSDLSAGVFEKPNLDMMAIGCEFVREAIETGGAEYSEPMWNYTTLIGVFTSGGIDDAKRMADGYPDYEEWKTEQKFEEKISQGAKPPMCTAISGVYKGCLKCPYLTAGKGPVGLATRIASSMQTQPVTSPVASSTPLVATLVTSGSNNVGELPDHYSRNNEGFIQLDTVQQDGVISSFPICTYPIGNAYLTDDPLTLNFVADLGVRKAQLIRVPVDIIGSPQTFRKTLQGQGLMIDQHPKALDRVATFMSAWVKNLQAKPDAMLKPVSYGWSDIEGKRDGFAYNGVMYTPKGEIKAMVEDSVLATHYTKRGDLKAWTTAAAMLTNQKRPTMDVILASAFAAPLFCLTGQNGALLSAYSKESGRTKTTALKVAQAVWGSPHVAMNQTNDTKNSVMHKMGVIRHLPIYYDEIKPDSDTREFRDLVYQITGGKDKNRLGMEMKQRITGTWQTLMVTTSNDNLSYILSAMEKNTVAGTYRIFEFEIDPLLNNNPGKINQADASIMIGDLNRNFGRAGEIYAEFLGSDPDRAEKEVKKCYNALTHKLNATNEERFWIATMASLIVGATFANQLQLCKIDIVKMIEFLVKCLINMRSVAFNHSANTSNVLNLTELLSAFFNENKTKHTVVTDIIRTAQNKHATVKLEGDHSKLDGIYIHRATKDNKIRISVRDFKRWLEYNKHQPESIIREIIQRYGAISTRAFLAGGTDWVTTQLPVLDIDITNYPELKLGD